METINWGRPLPPELLAEIHKCLPFGDAINVLVNVPSWRIVINNKPRMLRNVQRLRTSLKEYIGTLVNDERGEENNRRELNILNTIEWKPQFDALLRYGGWLTSTQQLWFGGGHIVGIPENFVQEFLLHLANTRSTQMMLHQLHMNLWRAPIPIPTFLKQLLNEKKQYPQFGGRTLFEESFELKADNGRTLSIFHKDTISNEFELTFIMLNKIDRKNWFEISIFTDPSKEFIRIMYFSRCPFNWLKGYRIEVNGNKLEAMQNIWWWNYKWDLFLRRGTAFTQIRHFKINKPYSLQSFGSTYNGYANFLISYICNTNHPEEFLESIDIKLDNFHYSAFAYKIWKICQKGIPEGGKLIKIGTEKLYILSAKTGKLEMKWLECCFGGSTQKLKFKFTLANIPTNGEYVFDFDVQLDGFNRIVGIKIEKRKVDNIVGLKCNDQIELTIDDEEKDGPTCSGPDLSGLICSLALWGIAGILFLIYQFVF